MKLLILIQSCHMLAYRRDHSRSTWVPRAQKLGIPVLYGEGGNLDEGISGDVLKVRADDSYEGLILKLKDELAMLLRRADWHYLIKADDDTVVNVSRACQIAEAMLQRGADSAGLHWDRNPCSLSGPCYLLSRRGARCIVHADPPATRDEEYKPWPSLLRYVLPERRKHYVADDGYAGAALHSAKLPHIDLPGQVLFKREAKRIDGKTLAVHDLAEMDDYRRMDELLNGKDS